jgi:3-oxoacyl-[acyl-carrier-protein] synthase-1
LGLYLHDLGIVCALGGDKQSVLDAWLAGQKSQSVNPDWLNSKIPALAVSTQLPEIPSRLSQYACRNNRLLLAAYQQIETAVVKVKQDYGPERIAVVLGTSTSGIAEGEQAVRYLQATGHMPAEYHYKQQELGGAAEFLAAYAGITGPVYTVSTTCSSSANALASARRLLQLNLCDAVIVGGADALCDTTLEGFSSLGALSQNECNPFSKNRDGTVLGEGAALFLMRREPASIGLLGVGASADAYHISAPRPDGSGALAAMQAALENAGLVAEQMDYLNLHGTATLQNDAMESLAVNRLFGTQLPCSSSKSSTGHCLGAAGAIEAGLCWLLLSETNQQSRLPKHVWDGVCDPELAPLGLVSLENSIAKRLQYCLSNSFSFGGNNVSLLIGRCL